MDLMPIISYLIKESINHLKDKEVKEKHNDKINGYIFLPGQGVLRYKEYT